jgi:hypothetical protein
MKGIEHYTAASGFHVISIHYTADPSRDPSTEEGKIWIAEESRGIVGGTASAQWRQEQEIDWNVSGGELVFPHMSLYREQIIVDPFEIPDSWDLYASYDHGHRNPAAFIVIALDHDGDLWIVWEMYKTDLGYRAIAKEIRECPFVKKNRLAFLPIADPSIWAKTQHQQDESEMKSIARLFFELPEDEQVVFAPGIRGGDITVAERIKGDLWSTEALDKGKAPRLRIFANCTKTIWEFTNLRYADWTPAMMQTRNVQESIIDKNNHAWDAFKMFMNQFFMSPKSPKQDALDKLKKMDPASWQEWMHVRKMYDNNSKSIMGDFD